ncbi:carbohydrate kinase [Candidatus Bathyarchaeota archaeon]|nr:carbohydrate kinase [Candidatus Bathyarchaeota archaeon]
MGDTHAILAHDVGTSGTKSILMEIADTINIKATHLTEYDVIYPPGIPHAAEQDPKDWWNAICSGTKQVLQRTRMRPEAIDAISFSTQAQCALFVDEAGNPLDNPYIWIDGRAMEEFEKGCRSGLLKIEGYNLFKVIKFLRITNGGPGSAKDPLWKYAWFKKHKPGLYSKLHKMLDVKDYLTFKCTGDFACSMDSANATWVFDTRKNKLQWHEGLCKRYGIDMGHLPEVRYSTDLAGELHQDAAREMGLVEGIPVIMGGIDASCIPIGSGSTAENDTHVYAGTSGWLSTTTSKRLLNIGMFEASVIGAIPNYYNFIGLHETSAGCLAWAKDHLADLEVKQAEQDGTSVFALLDEKVSEMPPGSNKVIFTPWLYGNRSPKEDTHVRGAFFNLGLQTRRREMFRAILEGVAFHARWLMEGFGKLDLPETFSYIGGGAKSDIWCQIMADVLQKKIQAVQYAQDGGAIGAAVIAMVGINAITFKEAKNLIPVSGLYEPNPRNKEIYDKLFVAFKKFHENNRSMYRFLNS